MDPLTTLLAALIGGASTALQTTVADIVKDAYAALKARIAAHYVSVDLATVERDPGREDTRRSLEEQLRKSGAAADSEVVAAAKSLLEHIDHHDSSQFAAVVGVDLESIKAGSVHIDDIVSSGSGVSAKKVVAAGDFQISGVRAGGVSALPGKL